MEKPPQFQRTKYPWPEVLLRWQWSVAVWKTNRADLEHQNTKTHHWNTTRVCMQGSKRSILWKYFFHYLLSMVWSLWQDFAKRNRTGLICLNFSFLASFVSTFVQVNLLHLTAACREDRGPWLKTEQGWNSGRQEGSYFSDDSFVKRNSFPWAFCTNNLHRSICFPLLMQRNYYVY